MTLKYDQLKHILEQLASNQNAEKYPTINDFHTVVSVLHSTSKWYEILHLSYVDIDGNPIPKDHIKYIRNGVKEFIERYEFDYDTSDLLIRSEILNPLLSLIETSYSQEEFLSNIDAIFLDMEQYIDYFFLDEDEEKRQFKLRVKNLLS